MRTSKRNTVTTQHYGCTQGASGNGWFRCSRHSNLFLLIRFTVCVFELTLYLILTVSSSSLNLLFLSGVIRAFLEDVIYAGIRIVVNVETMLFDRRALLSTVLDLLFLWKKSLITLGPLNRCSIDTLRLSRGCNRLLRRLQLISWRMSSKKPETLLIVHRMACIPWCCLICG